MDGRHAEVIQQGPRGTQLLFARHSGTIAKVRRRVARAGRAQSAASQPFFGHQGFATFMIAIPVASFSFA